MINEEDGNFSSTIKVSTYQCDNIIRQSFLGIIKIKKIVFCIDGRRNLTPSSLSDYACNIIVDSYHKRH